MNTPAFTVRFPIAAKLLAGVLSLIVIVVASLDFSAIVLVQNEKRAYTFQTQAMEALYAGRDMNALLTRAIDTVRIAMAGVDPAKGPDVSQMASIRSLLGGQSAVAAVALDVRENATGRLARVALVERARPAEGAPAKYDIGAALGPRQLERLASDGYVFLNLSKPLADPLVAVVLGKLQAGAAETPLATAFVPLGAFGKEIQAASLFITDHDGNVFFDTDRTRLFERPSVSDDPFFREAASSKVTTGAKVYESADGAKIIASYMRPGLGLLVMATTPWSEAMKPTYALVEKLVVFGIIALSAAVLFALYFAGRLTAPLKALYAATRRIGAGDFKIHVTPRSRDEVGALTHSFVAMSREIEELLVHREQRAKLESDLEVASTVQQRLIPPRLYQGAFAEIHSHYQSAEQCGGDWWGVFETKDKLCLMIGDATGHGLPSALITAAARSTFSGLQKNAEEKPGLPLSPAAMLSMANRAIYDAGSPVICMTSFVAVFDLATRKLAFANAAHTLPWILRQTPSGPLVIPLAVRGPMLGEKRDAAPYAEGSVVVEKNDILVLYTDGLTEGADAEGAMYGRKRARAVFAEASSRGPAAVVEKVMADLAAHAAGTPLQDDVTVVAARIIQ
jgi:serine phosphatase RsbU (regulator of sigma subunit)